MAGTKAAAPAFAAFILLFLVMVVEARLLLLGDAWWFLVGITMPLLLLVFQRLLGWRLAATTLAVFVVGVLALRVLLKGGTWIPLLVALLAGLSLLLAARVVVKMRAPRP